MVLLFYPDKMTYFGAIWRKINCFIYVIQLSTDLNFREVYQFALQGSSTADTVKGSIKKYASNACKGPIEGWIIYWKSPSIKLSLHSLVSDTLDIEISLHFNFFLKNILWRDNLFRFRSSKKHDFCLAQITRWLVRW